MCPLFTLCHIKSLKLPKMLNILEFTRRSYKQGAYKKFQIYHSCTIFLRNFSKPSKNVFCFRIYWVVAINKSAYKNLKQ